MEGEGPDEVFGTFVNLFVSYTSSAGASTLVPVRELRLGRSWAEHNRTCRIWQDRGRANLQTFQSKNASLDLGPSLSGSLPLEIFGAAWGDAS